MAIIRNNPLTEGFSGMIGGMLVFKNLRGKTIVAARPRAPRTQSEQQRKNRLRFKRAAAYAKSVMKDPEKKAYYWHKARKLELPNAYTAALADYMRKPVIKQVNVTKRKDVGHVVKINARKQDFAITSVAVKIKNEQSVVIENGVAIRNELQKDWHYRPLIPLMTGLSVEVSVVDLVGNVVTHNERHQ